MHVLHILDHSLPVPDGYAVRSHSILAEQSRHLELTILTSPKQERGKSPSETIDGIEYRRVAPSGAAWAHWPIGDQVASITTVRQALRDAVAVRRPDILHAHSPCLNAFAAFGLGVPVVYEMRSSWEDAAVSSGVTREGSARYRLSRWLETQALRRADAITTICEGLRRDAIARGIDPARITVAANAIDARKLDETLPDAAQARAKLGVQDRLVLGFVGSFFAWEGLDVLLRALPSIRERRPDALVLLVGGGQEAERLRALTATLGIEPHVRFTGQVPHGDVLSMYAAMDMLVFPRTPMRLTHMVTPIKPLEAMALRKLVVASDVGGHRELVEDGKTGVLFAAASERALADAVVAIAARPDLQQQMVARGHAYVREQRTWSHIARVYSPVYESLVGRHARSLEPVP
jgi:PEP-CTERM/exosortase A-associated glycosyltransferase